MKLRNSRSIIIICGYLGINLFVIGASLRIHPEDILVPKKEKSIAPEYTEIETLDYFHLKSGVPEMSLSAQKMKSMGEELAEFTSPNGVYNYKEKNELISYRADQGFYEKKKEVLSMAGDVVITAQDGMYHADAMDYFFKKDLVLGNGNILFEADDPKSLDHMKITSKKMEASPHQKLSKFEGEVKGEILRKKKYEGKMDFSSNKFILEGNQSLAHLEGDVKMRRGSYSVTSGKADLFLENYNKSLKYFVLNDDVKVTSKIQTPEGIQERKAFSERLEGFGAEQKMVLSGAPRVEMGKDVIKGYRITIRENVEMIEVDDAMSDVQLKKSPKVKE